MTKPTEQEILGLFNTTHHSHSFGGQDLSRGEHGEVGHVGEQVDDGHQRHGDADGARQVLGRLLDLLGDKVEAVPAGVAEEPGVEGQRDVSWTEENEL